MDKVKPAIAPKPIPHTHSLARQNPPLLPIKPSRPKKNHSINSSDKLKKHDIKKPDCVNYNIASDIIHSQIFEMQISSENTNSNNLYFSDVDDFNNSMYKISSFGNNIVDGQNSQFNGDTDTSSLTFSVSPLLTCYKDPLNSQDASDSNIYKTICDASLASNEIYTSINICDVPVTSNARMPDNSESENSFTALVDSSVLSENEYKKIPSDLTANFSANLPEYSSLNNIGEFYNIPIESGAKDILQIINPEKIIENNICNINNKPRLNVKAPPAPKPRLNLKQSKKVNRLADGNDSIPIASITAKPPDLFEHNFSNEQNSSLILLESKLPLNSNHSADLNDMENSKDNKFFMTPPKSNDEEMEAEKVDITPLNGFSQDYTPNKPDSYNDKDDKRKNRATSFTLRHNSSGIFKNIFKMQALPESTICKTNNKPRYSQQISTSSSVFYRDLSYTEFYNDIDESSPSIQKMDLNINTPNNEDVLIFKESGSVSDIYFDRDIDNGFFSNETINDIKSDKLNGTNNFIIENSERSMDKRNFGFIDQKFQSDHLINHLGLTDKRPIHNSSSFEDLKRGEIKILPRPRNKPSSSSICMTSKIDEKLISKKYDSTDKKYSETRKTTNNHLIVSKPRRSITTNNDSEWSENDNSLDSSFQKAKLVVANLLLDKHRGMSHESTLSYHSDDSSSGEAYTTNDENYLYSSNERKAYLVAKKKKVPTATLR